MTLDRNKREYSCTVCHKIFLRYPIHVEKRGKTGVYCSLRCYWQAKKNYTGERHSNWKGDNVGYAGLHKWLSKELGKARQCTWCLSMINVQWANVSHKYKRNLNDWMQLCGSCHSRYDDSLRRSWETRRRVSL